MSGTASRYIGGVPYGPAMGAGRYNPRAVSPGASLPVDTGGTVTLPQGPVRPGQTDGMGIAVNPSTGRVTPVGGSGGGDGMGNLLLMAGLGLLPYLPNAVDWIGNQFGGETPPAAAGAGVAATLGVPQSVVDAQEFMQSDPGLFLDTAPAQNAPNRPPAPQGNPGSGLGSVLGVPQSVIDAQEFMQGDPGLFLDGGGSGVDGFTQMGVSPADFSSVSAPAGGAVQGAGWNSLPQTLPDNWLQGSLGETPVFGGDLATGLAGAGGGAIGGLISAQNPWTREGYGGIGQQVGSALGGIGGGMAAGALMGSAVGPVGTAFGALAGAFAGGMAGSAGGAAMGPLPTIGRNFSGTGTFNADGSLSFGGMGGDNGGTAEDAQTFGNTFGRNLLAQAAQQGLAFNPNMAGVQFNLGGFDNFSRSGVAPGGFFYDPSMSGSPENFALRPNAGMDPFSAQQGNAFTSTVLADLAARDVFTPGGQGRGRDFYNSTLGADLGGYGYNTYQNGGFTGLDDFGSLLQQRQGAIGGWLGQQQQQQAAEAAARAQLDQSNRWAAMNTSGISATNLLAAQNDPNMASTLGLGGITWNEGTPFFDTGFTSSAPISWQDSA